MVVVGLRVEVVDLGLEVVFRDDEIVGGVVIDAADLLTMYVKYL